ncbi:nischarin [Trichomycterus rosablanca]|uniref:nischarin n=1 Tax=Trichomycterus rosablanca TaxID=2290929 RepID=UPI002F35CD1D
MDCAGFPEQNTDRNVCIVGSKLVENYTVYIIEVVVGDHRWTVEHRYSDFHDLHEKLTSEKKIDKHLLPPKKIIGKNSKSLVEKRQKELEVYLQTLLSRFPVAVPKVLSIFLHFHFYEINGIAAALAEDLFHRGEQFLAAGEVFLLKPLQLYAVTQQLKLAKPTCANGDAKADLGHILDFACRLKYLKIPGTKGAVGTSNIEEESLPFDLSVFKSLLQIEMTECSSGQIKGISSLKSTLATLTVHNSAASMKEILVPEAAEFAQWEAEGVDIDCTVTAIIPTWRMLTTLDMSHNDICCIDESVKLIPAVEFLDLSHNCLSLVENLQYLYNLVHLDLSWNKLTVLQGVHTKLGNIKTLNLAGNQLETLSGLSKLYSLVNLDLSRNRIAQLDEIKHIGTLPCLEKLSLTENPMCIIPDYRTKVLALFGDRASEVCLDGTVTTEKELDTVEVLKAIQKAKEAKDRMATSEKKVSAVPVHSDGGVNVPSSGAVPAAQASSSAPAPPAPPAAPPAAPAPHCSNSSQELTRKEEAFIAKEILTHVDSTLTQRCFNNQTLTDFTPQVKTSLTTCLYEKNPSEPKDESDSCFYCENQDSWTKRYSTPVLPSSYLSYTTTDLDFITQLSELIRRAGASRKTSNPETVTDPVEVTDRGSPDSSSSYFEMGPDHSDDIMGCSSSTTLQEESETQNVETTDPRIDLLVWCYCIAVKCDEGLKQMTCCLAATGDALVLFQVQTGEPACTLQELMEGVEIALLVPYFDIKDVQIDVPDTCVSLSLKSSGAKWFIFSDAQNLNEIHSHLDSVVDKTLRNPGGPANVQLFAQQFLNSWEIDENESGAKSGHLAHVLNRASFISPTQDPKNNSAPPDVLSSIQESQTFVPLMLFLTTRHLCILKLDFRALSEKDVRSCTKMTRIPLASALIHPKRSRAAQGGSDAHRFCHAHVLEIMAGHERLAVIFALPHDKFLFLGQFAQFRAGLRDIKTVALLQNGQRRWRAGSTPQGDSATTHLSVHQEVQKSHLTLSLLYPSESLVQQLSEENQCPSHLSLSSSLQYLSSLRGHELVAFFHDNIAEVENEELKHILWTSVLFYKSPDVELSACVMLSTKAVYFILDDVASTLGDQTMTWTWHPSEHEEPDFLLTFCFVMKLHELQCVNVGLFDQYFRMVGASPEHIISCLTRESYSTHHFLQQLMSVLSLLEKAPSPEPSEQDFYTQFGKKSTGKMENYELLHSSRVKFMYPSEEEIGDLTFIAAERKGPQGPAHSFNVLFYALAFQVQSGPGAVAELHPKSLVLSGTHVFLLDEDYISYPLPQFAKEPPQRDKYGLTDARRIRDLDRVLMGYQPYPQALTLVFDDVPGPDLLCHLTMDHFSEERRSARGGDGAESEVQWCIFVPGADSRERLISLLARQWEALCSRELPLELTG